MSVRKPRAKKNKLELPEVFIRFFLYGEKNYDADDDDSLDLYMMMDSKELKALWKKHETALTQEFQREYPGEVPFAQDYFKQEEEDEEEI